MNLFSDWSRRAKAHGKGHDSYPLVARSSASHRSDSARTGNTTNGEKLVPILQDSPSEDFVRCWRSAAEHLMASAQDRTLHWIKGDLNPPFLEHLSFRIENQVFFVGIVDVEGKVVAPGNINGFQKIAPRWNGHACVMPMRRFGSDWKPSEPGWGLLHPGTREPVDPLDLISTENIEMTDWELHDFAVGVIGKYIRNTLKHQVTSIMGARDLDPSIWFMGDSGLEWVVVRAVRYPARDAERPVNIAEITRLCRQLSNTGHFASVAVVNGESLSDPLWRGSGMFVRFLGLESITV